ncbi:dockerin [Duganella sp. FT92W]|uniref:Dockerin n=1 Tax=Pseudoduganella rivuli TaxID=2666085 RepID=A0A7X2IMA3_9BURK|nr:dockerin [Pseudoduganella rivuli]
MKWGGGGYVTGTIYHPVNSSLLYARTDVGGAYRWNATNSTWTPITDGIGFGPNEGRYHGVESIALDPNNDQLVYMVTGDTATSDQVHNGRIYISSDRGTNWTYYDLPFAVGGNDDGRAYGERLSIDPQLPSIMYYATRKDGLWKSTDSGHTWNQVTSFSSTRIATGGQKYGTVQVLFDTPNRGTGQQTWVLWATVSPDYVQAAGLTSSLYKSTNGGATWTPVAVPSAVSGYHIPHMVRAGDGYFYMAFNQNGGQGQAGPGYVYKFGGGANGGTWTQLMNSSLFGVGGLSINGTGSTTRIAVGMTAWFDGSKQIQMSDNAGATWREVEANMPHTSDSCKGWIESVTIDPANRDHIMHVHGGGICETTNASSATPTWSPKVNNLEETATLFALAPPAGAQYKLINAAGDIGPWVITDLATRPTKSPTPGWSSGNAVDLVWSDPSYIAVSGVDNANNHTVKGFWSGDSGNSWSQFSSLPAGAAANGSHVQSIAAPSRNNVIWAPPDSVPSYSTNNGASWTSTNLPGLPAVGGGWPRAYRLAADRKNPNKVYAFDSGGADWSWLPGKVYVSTDGGHNFTLSQGSVNANMAWEDWVHSSIFVNPNAEGDIWVTDGNTVYHSLDSGATWVKSPVFATANGTKGASKVTLGKALAGSSYSAAVYVEGTVNGQWGIYRSDDGGATWSRFNDDAHQFGGNTVVVGDWNTYGRIYVNGAARGLQYSN